MFPHHLLEDLAIIYQQEYLEQARKTRLAKEVKAGNPGLRDRFLSKSGDLLILFGQKLKERYEPRIQRRHIRQRPLAEGASGDC